MAKDLTYYMSLPYKMVIVKDVEDDSYVLYFPELPGCMTSGKTAAAALANAEDAKESWLIAAMEDQVEIQEPEAVSLDRILVS
ncbi:MAG: type II toxin-antitoxin system HicB family antitoxin [Lachnospiraceae bacterium]|nr:type II toxin-antitoxin system HicB family antitoxin [Lachnospiraceae bacterium]